MTDYSELVKALRYCGNFTEREGCDESCEYFNDMDCPKRIMSDAAAAIEDMAKHITEMHERVTVLQIDRGHLETEVKEWRRLNNENLLPKRGEWVRVEDGESYHYECSRCGERPLYSRYGDVVLSGVCPMCGAKMEVQDDKA